MGGAFEDLTVENSSGVELTGGVLPTYVVEDDGLTVTLDSVDGVDSEVAGSTAEDEGSGVVYHLSVDKDAQISYTIEGDYEGSSTTVLKVHTLTVEAGVDTTITIPVGEADHGLTTPVITIV